ncbi:kinesin family member 6/9 [Mytilus galloprovincialis]|uniref:Kinesin-like protein n=1 Tax=Mytilus galloprovincialis TaxID=29158 RepID=A0A8B6DRG8_MYTGA|nr:kinesin family member 6/9 [Mytilus galloprovincialis]
MVKQTIQIFGRVKPTRSKAGLYEIDEDDESHPRLTITVPRELADGFVNNKKENYKFRFQKVFDQSTQQDEIFDNVAKPVADSVMQGYNGTIFAYGQTGSGKTFTITGGAERYTDRGIIPRCLSYFFEQFEQDGGRSYTLHISYLEIYNENGYDLLDPKHDAAKLEDLPKVSLMEDTDQNIHLKNLSVHPANSEEEALNLLFLGDTNRMIAETPMNQASTRSHCIFTVHLTSTETGSATIRRSKLHLVDLAGSERVSKTGVNGVLLKEAKYINLSLHFLEQVIIALADKSRQHIPYRNSMMTSVIRDSLGGNCMTTMIATCSVEKKNIDETISTCRFAQRVAMIKNDVMVNEELDPKLLIARLKKEVQQLKEELAMATGEQRTDSLTEEELSRCKYAVDNYLADNDKESTLDIGADMRKIQYCYSLLKQMVQEKPKVVEVEAQQRSPSYTDVDTGPYRDSENGRLKELILQRDNEINILVGMLKKEKKRSADAMAEVESFGRMKSFEDNSRPSSGRRSRGSRMNTAESLSANKRNSSSTSLDEQTKTKILGDMSTGRQVAFETFKRDYPNNSAIEDNKDALKQKYVEAKKLGEYVNKSRTKINHVKSQIEQYRMQLAMRGLVDPEDAEPDEEEQEMRNEMEEEKMNYKECFTRLRTLKTEIEHLQHLLEKSKVKLMKDFEMWWADQVNLQQNNNSSRQQKEQKSAWRTPTPNKSVQNGVQSSQQYAPDGRKQSVQNGIQSSQQYAADGRKQSVQNGNQSSQQFSMDGRKQFDPSQRSPYESNSRKQYDTVDNDNRKQYDTGQRRPPGLPKSRSDSGNLPMTGDAKADADIMAFIKARQNLLRQAQDKS